MSQVAFFKTDTDEIVMTFWFFQIMPKTLNPQWREQFDFHLYEERGGIIDITAWDKDAGKRCIEDDKKLIESLEKIILHLPF